jgi:hypothetical protein
MLFYEFLVTFDAIAADAKKLWPLTNDFNSFRTSGNPTVLPNYEIFRFRRRKSCIFPTGLELGFLNLKSGFDSRRGQRA